VKYCEMYRVAHKNYGASYRNLKLYCWGCVGEM